jgi:ABC-type transporter Mla subunit MlaD
MALQDLTPQLRTRLSRMERAVGWFVILAAGLLLFGFAYYIYNTAERKGWFKIKALYYTYTDAATGLKEGDPVKLMGLDVGRITDMKPMPAEQFDYNMYVEFELQDPYYGYVWTEGSKAKVAIANLVGTRYLEVSRGTGGYPTYIFNPFRIIDAAAARSLPEWEKWQLGQDIYDATASNLVLHALTPLSTNLPTLERLGVKQFAVLDARKGQEKKYMTAMWNDGQRRYDAYFKGSKKKYPLPAEESPAITDRIEKLVDDVEKALPNILTLTNQLATVLSNSANLTSNLNAVALGARPMVSNLTAATANLDHPGALGDWLFPTNITTQLEGTLGNANATLVSVNTNLTAVIEEVGRSLDNLADLTGNLNHQVQQNTNILGNISKAVVDTDDLVQGLKRHWLFRSAFKNKSTNSPPAKPKAPR